MLTKHCTLLSPIYTCWVIKKILHGPPFWKFNSNGHTTSVSNRRPCFYPYYYSHLPVPPSIFFALEILRVISGSVSDQLWIFVYIEFHILIPPTYICLNSRLVTAIQFTADLVLLCWLSAVQCRMIIWRSDPIIFVYLYQLEVVKVSESH